MRDRLCASEMGDWLVEGWKNGEKRKKRFIFAFFFDQKKTCMLCLCHAINVSEGFFGAMCLFILLVRYNVLVGSMDVAGRE